MKLSTTLKVQVNEKDYEKQLLNERCNYVTDITEEEEKYLQQALSNIEIIYITNAKDQNRHIKKVITDITFMRINDYNLIRILIISWSTHE